MSRLQSRKWKICEDFREYFHEKIIVANKLKLPENVVIHYLINGIEDFNIRIQVAGQNFSEKIALLDYMVRLCSNLNCKDTTRKKEEITVNENAIERKKEKTSYNKNEKTVRCFNCSKFGHLSSTCPEPRRDRNACFKCNKTGHIAKNCPSANAKNNSETTLLIQNSELKPAYFLTFVAMKNGHNYTHTGLVDSGSPINLVKMSKVTANEIQPIERENFQL